MMYYGTGWKWELLLGNATEKPMLNVSTDFYTLLGHEPVGLVGTIQRE